jgi:hypothetical protein
MTMTHTGKLGHPLNLPRLIDSDVASFNDDGIVKYILAHWCCPTGVDAVCHHICLVAAGMAVRSNRSDKEVPFLPFASWDAHILLQLKRTPTEGSRVKLFLDAALSSGKAGRDPNQVSELKPLRNYGTGNSKYSIDPPAALTDAAAQAALRLAIEPTVQDYLERLNAMWKRNYWRKLTKKRGGCARSFISQPWIYDKVARSTLILLSKSWKRD